MAPVSTGHAENVLVLREYPEVARQYEAEWFRLWNESTASAALA